MVFFNHATRQMTAKIVYYGPGLCGKTTNLSAIYERTSQKARGEMVSLNTETDRTLFFDLLPMEVGIIGGFRAKLQLYTVPGQVFYNSTRKLVLKGVDGIVFVADSQTAMLDANRESYQNLAENLRELGLDLADIPMVFQWNKRDLKQIVPVEVLERELNPRQTTSFPAIARSGEGVFETLRGISRLALAQIKHQHLGDGVPARPLAVPAAPPETPAWSRPTPALLPVFPVSAEPMQDTHPGLDTLPGLDGRKRVEAARDRSLPEALSFLDPVPAEPQAAPELPEALSFLDLSSSMDGFESLREDPAPVARRAAEPHPPADGQVKVMAPMVVKLLPPQPSRTPGQTHPGITAPNGLAPRVTLKAPSALPAPRLPHPLRPLPPALPGRPAPVLKVALPAEIGSGELEVQVQVRRNGELVAQARAAVPWPGPDGSGTLSVEFKRS